MEKKKKYSKYDDEPFRIIINKQLEKYNITIDDVKNGDHEKDWYSFYTFSPEEHEQFKWWMYDFLKNNVREYSRLTKKKFERDFSWFDLCYGLKIEENAKM